MGLKTWIVLGATGLYLAYKINIFIKSVERMVATEAFKLVSDTVSTLAIEKGAPSRTVVTSQRNADVRGFTTVVKTNATDATGGSLDDLRRKAVEQGLDVAEIETLIDAVLTYLQRTRASHTTTDDLTDSQDSLDSQDTIVPSPTASPIPEPDVEE
ncbi:protein ORF142 [Cyprinid herpesvirus 2]|nr:protein ORF142 [Cyprinid herpesvirus 2]